MIHQNEGTVKLIKAIRSQSKKVYDVNIQSNMLGTMTSKGIYIDSIEDEIPREDFLILQTGETISNGDRVVCIPCGDYFIVLGKVE